MLLIALVWASFRLFTRLLSASPAQSGLLWSSYSKPFGFVAFNLESPCQSNPVGAHRFQNTNSCINLCVLTRSRPRTHIIPLARVRFLCGRLGWTQGDFFDDAGLGSGSGFGTDSGLASGRHVRYNYDNYTKVGRRCKMTLVDNPRQLCAMLALTGRGGDVAPP